MGGSRGRRKQAAMADDGMSGRTTEADGCGICKRQIGLEISSEMAPLSPRGKRHPSQRLHSPLPSNNRTTARRPPLDILYLLDTNSEKLDGEGSSLNIIARALLVTIFSNYTCTKNGKKQLCLSDVASGP